MASVFGWLDADEGQRKQMLEVVKLFQDEGSVDELGIGTVRDALANYLFPATSVLHTRARYFLFIPWLMRDVARRGLSVEKSLAELRRGEVRLINALLTGGEQQGVIGSQMRDRLKTMPSSMYWAALGCMGLRIWDVSIDAHFRSTAQRGRFVSERSTDDDPGRSSSFGFHPDLGDTPQGLLEETTFDLSADEAEFLRRRLQTMPGESLYSWMAAHATSASCQYIWEHPQIADFPEATRPYVEQGRQFHHISFGAPLLYNLMLAELQQSEELIASYEDEIEQWAGELDAARVVDQWDAGEFWTFVRRLNPRIALSTEHFVNRWALLVTNGEHTGARARELVKQRELRLKGRRSRLVNAEARQTWTGRSGLVPIDYRWRIAANHLTDLMNASDA